MWAGSASERAARGGGPSWSSVKADTQGQVEATPSHKCPQATAQTFLFPGHDPARRPHGTIPFSYKTKIPKLQGKSWTLPPSHHVPSCITRQHRALFGGVLEHTHYLHGNKPALSCSAPPLQNKVVFERGNSLRFCLPNRGVKVPGARTPASTKRSPLTGEQVWRDKAKLRPKSDGSEGRGGCVVLGPVAQRRPGAIRFCSSTPCTPFSPPGLSWSSFLCQGSVSNK